MEMTIDKMEEMNCLTCLTIAMENGFDRERTEEMWQEHCQGPNGDWHSRIVKYECYKFFKSKGLIKQ